MIGACSGTRLLALSALAFALGLSHPFLPPEIGIEWVLGGFLYALGPGRAAGSGALVWLLLSFAAAGSAQAERLAASSPAAPLSIGSAPLWIEGSLRRAPSLAPEGARLELELIATASAARAPFVPARGGLLLFGPRAIARFQAGDRLRFLARADVIVDLPFPGAPERSAELAYTGTLATEGAIVRVAQSDRAGPRLLMERWRGRVQQAIEDALPPRQAAVVRAFATGDRSGVDPALAQSFARSGLSHLLAVSGLNLAIVSGLCVVLLGALIRRQPRLALGPGAARSSALLAMPCVLLYTLLVGATPSAARAAVMVGAVLAGRVLRRASRAALSLSLAALVLIALDPATLGDVSFQLSFVAVLGLLELRPALLERLPAGLRGGPAWRRACVELVVATLAATAAASPLLARHFGQVPVLGLLANLPAAPLSSFLLVPLSLLGGVLGALHPALGVWPLRLAGALSDLLVLIAEQGARLPLAAVSVPAPNDLELIAVYVAMFLLAAAYAPGRDGLLPTRQKRRRCLGAGGAALLLALSSFGVDVGTRWASPNVRLSFLPVGQGDAAVIELPGGKVVLVDCGPPGAAERVILPFLRSRRIGQIDLLVLTHPHADHVGGLVGLERALPIREVWWTGDRRQGDAAMLEPLGRLSALQVQGPGPVLAAGLARLQVIGPLGGAEDYALVNDASIVLALELGDQRVLLLADAEAEAEADLIERWGPGLRADLIKLGHHGSKTSSSEALLDAVRPTHALISVGAGNGFGFPHAVVLERLGQRGIGVWRTDRGAVLVEISSAGLVVR